MKNGKLISCYETAEDGLRVRCGCQDPAAFGHRESCCNRTPGDWYQDGAPDAQALLAEARAQAVEARERLEISNKCRLANEAELIRADMTIGSLRSAADQARRERDECEALVQQYRAQHDAEAKRRGCPYCTCETCAAAMRRTAVLP